METTVYKRKIAFAERICPTVFFLLVCFVVSVHDMIPHTHHGKILSYVVKSLGENVECYFNHHPTERFKPFENVEIKHSKWNKITTILYADMDCHIHKNLPSNSYEEGKPYRSYYMSATVGSIQLRAPPFV